MSMNETQTSAFDIIKEVLDMYGLPELSEFIGNFIVDNDVIDDNVLIGQIRGTDEYKARFAANEARRKAGLNVLSEGQYIALENTYRQYLRASGLPAGFYDNNEDFQNLISNDVSPGELAERVNQGYEAIQYADPAVIREMQELYGVSEGDLAAFFLDPDRATPMLLKQAKAVELGAGAREGGGQLSVGEAERLVDEGLSRQQVREGMALITDETTFGLTEQERQAGQQELSREEQIGAVFGTDPKAAQRQRKRMQARQAQFQQGGSFSGQGSELTGLT